MAGLPVATGRLHRLRSLRRAGRPGRLHVPGRFGNITVTAAQGLELQVVAAVVVGGVQHLRRLRLDDRRAPRRLLIEILQQSLLRWAAISEFVRDAILGLLILIAVTADTIILGGCGRCGCGCVGASRRGRRHRAQTEPAMGASPAMARHERLVRRLRGWEGLLLLILLVVVLLNTTRAPNFLTRQGYRTRSTSSSSASRRRSWCWP